MTFEVQVTSVHSGSRRWIAVDGENEGDARRAIIQHLGFGESAGKIRASKRGARGRLMSLEDRSDFCQTLSELMLGGLPFRDALEGVRRGSQKKQVVGLLDRMIKRADIGAEVGVNFQAEEALLGTLIVAMAKQGDASRNVPQALQMAAKMLDRESRRMSTLVENLAMPVAALVVWFAMMIVAGLVIIPMFRESIDTTIKINPLTAVSFAYADFMRGYWWIWAPAIAVAIYLGWFSARFRAFGLRMVQSRFSSARHAARGLMHGDFCMLVGALLKSGLHLHRAILLTAQRFKDLPIGEQLQRVAKDVEAGGDVKAALELHSSLPWEAVVALDVAMRGQDTGGSLIENADRAYFRAERHFSRFGRQATFAVIVVVSIGVLILALSFYAPMFSSFEAVRRG